MKLFILLSLVLSFNIFAKPAPAQPLPYKLDTAHASLTFGIKHMMLSTVKGSFAKWDGDFYFDKATGNIENVKFAIESTSVNTNDAKRDEHLRGADFFNVEKFPKIEFVGKKVEIKNKKPVALNGDLTMLGVTKPVKWKVDYLGAMTNPFSGQEFVVFKGTTKINRKDFGMTFNKALDKGGLALGEDVEIAFDFEAIPTNK